MFELPRTRNWSPTPKTRPRATEEEFGDFYRETAEHIDRCAEIQARRTGVHPGDVRAELLVYLWENLGTHDPSRGSAQYFVWMCSQKIAWRITKRWRKKVATYDLYEKWGDPLDVIDHATPTPDEAAERAEMVASLRAALAELGERPRRVLAARFGLEHGPDTLREIGEELGVTREAVRQAEQRALRKLAEIIRAEDDDQADAADAPVTVASEASGG